MGRSTNDKEKIALVKIKCPYCGSVMGECQHFTLNQDVNALQRQLNDYYKLIFKIHELIEYYEHHDLRSDHASILQSLLE